MTAASALGASKRRNTTWPTPPPGAVAAGFTRLAFIDDFTNASTIATSSAQSSGANWYYSFDNTAQTTTVNTTQTAASLSNGNTSGGANASPVGGIVSIKNTGASVQEAWITVPGSSLNNSGAVQPAAGVGNWAHCYIEGYFQFNPATAPSAGSWPAFWAWSLEGLKTFGFGSSALAATSSFELDMYESFGTQNFSDIAGSFDSTIHVWSLNPNRAINIVDGFPPSNPPFFNSEWHTVGVLWQDDGLVTALNVLLIQGINTAGTTGGTVLTTANFAGPTTSGNTIIVSVGSYSTTTPVITDTRGTTYSLAATSQNGGSNANLWVFYGTATTTGTNAVRATISTGLSFTSISAVEFSGITSFDTAVNGLVSPASGAAVVTAPSITTSGAGIIFTAMKANSQQTQAPWTAGSGFSILDDGNTGFEPTEYKASVAAQVGVAATMTTPSTSTLCCTVSASFRGTTSLRPQGHLQMYFDNVAVGSSLVTGDVNSSWPLEGQHLFVVLQAGGGAPTFVDWIRVWQAP